ncbi:MAG: hypothetical protein IIB27_03235, partial [Chloroflexi bacterium]|nr:hypothetical protein [Chloroflexota bacterium]
MRPCRDASLSHARAFHTATLLDSGGVLLVGGSGPQGVLSSAEVFDPESNAWAAPTEMSDPRSFHTATLLKDGRVLVTGGISRTGP